MIKYQNYSHYKLPITMDPLKYGKLIEQIGNKFIITLTTPTNIAVIKQINNENFVRIFRKGELIFEYKEIKISDIKFIRIILDQRFTFEKNKLISTEILSALGSVIIFNSNNITPLYENTKALSINNINRLYFLIFMSIFLSLLIIGVFEFIYSDLGLITSFLPGIRFYSKKENIIKLRRLTSKHNWDTIYFKINKKIFSKKLFEKIFNKFWNQLEFKDNNHLFILFKVKYLNNEISTIGKLQNLSSRDKDWYISWIINNMEFKSEYYNETQIESFIISYGFKEGKIRDKNSIKSNINFQSYKNQKLVVSYNPFDYGILINKITLKDSVVFILQENNGLTISFRSFEKYNQVELFKDGTNLIKFTDFKLTENRFMRIIDNKKFYFENNQQILSTKEIKSRFISKLEKSNKLINNFITLDIETYIKDSILIPFCISIYDGKRTYSFFLSDFKDSKDLILSSLKSILTRKYNGYNVYIHNMAKFDIIFLLKHLVELGDVQPIIHNDRIISINFNFGKDLEYSLQFKDSYLILLASLAKLTKGFGVKTLKSTFPFLFVNKDNLNYYGQVPEFYAFGNKISKSDYKNYISKFNNNWGLRSEAIKYCETDCISLYQVIFKFSELIFSLFRKNIHKYPTLPSLAFAIFRTNFMDKNFIPQLSGKIAKDIRQSYTGGAVDMYIPQPSRSVKLYAYDVNSLYPFTMKECDMPVGNAIYFDGNIRTIVPDAFGFFYCKIIAPDNIKHPIIQTHVRTNNGIRTLSPVGHWEDMLFSEELDNALKFGDKFYSFKLKNNLFKTNVDQKLYLVFVF